MIQLKTKEEIALMYLSAQMVSKTLGLIAKEIRPGITSKRLDKLAYEFIKDHGGEPAFLGYGGFPNSLCTSPNEQVVHGIPNDVPLKEGDILSVDCGVVLNGFVGDHAYTFEIGEVSADVKKLLRITKESLYKGIAAMRPGNRVGDIGHAIQSYCEKEGYGVVRELVGHGLGREMHEEPQVPNYGRRGKGKKLEEGIVLAIEPMINMGTHKVDFHRDGWTVTTRDKKPSAHFEHDAAIVDGKPVLLSTFKFVYEALGIESDEEEPFLYKLSF